LLVVVRGAGIRTDRRIHLTRYDQQPIADRHVEGCVFRARQGVVGAVEVRGLNAIRAGCPQDGLALLTAIFTGLRASELRGLRWTDVDLDRREVHVHQRADRFNSIANPKSIAGERTVPAPPIVINALREWKLICPRRDTGKVDPDGQPIMVLDLVFPNGLGNVEQLNNIVRRGLQLAQIAAGVTVDTGEVHDGKPILKAKYKGLHALRHFYASWCINRQEEGGLGLPLKVVQERMGHSSVTMTADVYGHLFPRGDDAAELARAESALLA
jgi:integrase